MLRTLFISPAPDIALTSLTFLLVTGLSVSSSFPAQAADAPNGCSSVIGRIVSRQGAIELRRAGQQEWTRLQRRDTPICQGDQIRVGPSGRAAFMIGPQIIVRVDQNTTLSVAQTDTEVTVELAPVGTLPGVETKDPRSAVYVITREKRTFRVRTPFYSAVHEGTEFLVSGHHDRGELYVFEGRVTLEDLADTAERLRLRGGQAATIAPGAPRAVRLLVKPPDAVQWTLYYPPAADPDAPDEELLARDCARLDPGQHRACSINQAEALLRLGRVDEARGRIEDVLASAPENGDAKALSAIIAIVRNEKDEALALSREATRSSPGALRPWIALSYAQQASFDLEAALQSAKRAADAAPESAVVRARLAELLMSLGRMREAETEARHAVKLNPKHSRAHLILGFVHLAQINTKAAREDFLSAIELDEGDPLPRLGLGLAIIRDGELALGREQFEIAVALDPANPLLRAYLGKGYYEENTRERDELAATQFRLAQELDPTDPTAWFYDAIRLQTLNRPGEALEELQQSIARNENRAVYRSRFLLDQDQAARSASQAGVYSDLGFDELAVTEARNALTGDPGSFSAHRFLTEAYGQLPRFEIARLSETLQSQLLQPVSAAPLPPQLQQIRSPVLLGSGPITASFQEFNPLFAQDRHALSISGVAGSDDTLSDEIIYGYYRGQSSFQLGQFHYETDGSRPNADLHQDHYRAFYQQDVSTQTSLQAELTQSSSRYGDVASQFDPSFDADERNRNEVSAFRLGGRYAWKADSMLVASLVTQRQKTELTDSGVVSASPFQLVTFERDNATLRETYAGELAYFGRNTLGDIVAGAGAFEERDTTSRTASGSISLPGLPPIVVAPDTTTSVANLRSDNAYAYGYLGEPGRSRLILGASVNRIDNDRPGAPALQTYVNPKLGLVLPFGTTTLRAAAFRGVKPDVALNPHPTIEPTQVAGFNQIFDDIIQTRFWRFGAGIDQKWSQRVFGGLEVTRRNLEVPRIEVPVSYERRTEWMNNAYLSALVTPRLAASGAFLQERLERNVETANPDTTMQIDTQSLGLSLSYYHPSGVFALGRLTFVRQGIESPGASQTENFKVFDLSFGARSPRRWGIISLDVKNLFNEKFQFRDTAFEDPINPRAPLFVPRRSVFLRLQLSF